MATWLKVDLIPAGGCGLTPLQEFYMKENLLWGPCASRHFSTPSLYCPEQGEEWGGEQPEWRYEVPFTPGPTPLEVLREWISGQRFLPQDLTDDFLWQFLISNGYDIDHAEQKLQCYFYTQQEFRPLFGDRDLRSESNIRLFKQLYVVALPGFTDDGWLVLLTGLLDHHYRRYCPVSHLKAIALVLDLLLWENDLGFGDVLIVMDCRGFREPDLLHQPVFAHRTYSDKLKNAFPGHFRGFYLLYPPKYISEIAAVHNGVWVNTFLNKQQLRDRLPGNMLPLETGGNIGHLTDILSQWSTRLTDHRDFFVQLETRMVNDYRRRLCHMQEKEAGGRAWIYRLQLVADEYEYKKKYYATVRKRERRKGWGKLRGKCPDRWTYVDPLADCRRMVREEAKRKPPENFMPDLEPPCPQVSNCS